EARRHQPGQPAWRRRPFLLRTAARRPLPGPCRQRRPPRAMRHRHPGACAARDRGTGRDRMPGDARGGAMSRIRDAFDVLAPAPPCPPCARRSRARRLAALAGLLACTSLAVQAGDCTITTTPVNFGVYDPITN